MPNGSVTSEPCEFHRYLINPILTNSEPTMKNVLPNLPRWTYEALKASILRWKVILPVVKDENGNVIDGHQRVRACEELGISDYPVLILAGLTEEEKHDHAYILNLLRRRLTQQQMRDLIAAELKRTPDLSDNWLAQLLGTTDKTVEAVRQKLISSSEIPKLDALRGKDGKYRRVTRIVTNTAKEAERAQEALQTLGDQAPRKDWDLRLAEQRVRRMKIDTGDIEVSKPLPDASIRLYHCPFQKLEEVVGIEPHSINLVLTDIPYDKEFLPQVADLGAFAARVLVEGGLFVTYCGQYHFDYVLRTLSEHLTYRWMKDSRIENDANLIHPYQILSFWKPILIYSKGPWKERRQWHDVSRAQNKEKDWHPDQQPLDEVERLIRDFSDHGDSVCDPCGGGFTTAVACQRLGDRSCVSCDIDKVAVINGLDRLAGKPPPSAR
jgi:ParB-like chromosome segregation protein Spo0J